MGVPGPGRFAPVGQGIQLSPNEPSGQVGLTTDRTRSGVHHPTYFPFGLCSSRRIRERSARPTTSSSQILNVKSDVGTPHRLKEKDYGYLGTGT
jgi:hypothetical protein